MNRNAKWIAAALVVIATFCTTFALAQTLAPGAAKPTAKTETDDWQTRAKAAIASTLTKYVYRYKPADDQKAKLEKVLIAQYKDLMDHDKIHAPKIKVVDDKIAVLQKEIAALEKQKAVSAKNRAEMLLDHKAELDNVFTEQQRIASIVSYLKSIATHRYWGGFSGAQQANLTEQFEAAALKVVQAKPEDSEKVYAEVRRELQNTVGKLLTPEVRQAGESKHLADSAIQSFYRIKLTDSQKDQVLELCNNAAKRKAELSAQYRQLDKDRDTVRAAMYKYGTTEYQRKMRAEISEKILTEEQRKANSSSRSSRSGSSRRRPPETKTKTPK